jgi:hypothetical protein
MAPATQGFLAMRKQSVHRPLLVVLPARSVALLVHAALAPSATRPATPVGSVVWWARPVVVAMEKAHVRLACATVTTCVLHVVPPPKSVATTASVGRG